MATQLRQCHLVDIEFIVQFLSNAYVIFCILRKTIYFIKLFYAGISTQTPSVFNNSAGIVAAYSWHSF